MDPERDLHLSGVSLHTGLSVIPAEHVSQLRQPFGDRRRVVVNDVVYPRLPCLIAAMVASAASASGCRANQWNLRLS